MPLRVMDTSVWIEWLIDSPLGKKLGSEFPERTHCVVPTIVQLELAKWLLREVSEDAANQVMAIRKNAKSSIWIPTLLFWPSICTASTNWRLRMPLCTPLRKRRAQNW